MNQVADTSFNRGQPGSERWRASDSARVVIPPTLGSVVAAIPAARLPEFAEAALSSTFYLALSPVGA